MLGNVNYLTSPAFDMETITAAAHKYAGFNLAHGAGNLALDCIVATSISRCGARTSATPAGRASGCFVHERHAAEFTLHASRAGGTTTRRRAFMGPDFDPIAGAKAGSCRTRPFSARHASRVDGIVR